ncbi:MAG: penicillin acylase family protein [Acidobacteria bacterium]|nr:penicillin acylase family protein [Acidobacteriota bacterium]
MKRTSLMMICALALSALFYSHHTTAKDAVKKTKTLPLDKVAQSVTIYRDTWGVPHVYGPTDYSVMFGFIYAQCEDNFWQVEDSYIQSLGRAAEVYGEKHLVDDLTNRALEITRLSQEEYAKLGPAMKEACQATADGYNYYVAKNPQAKPRLLTQLEPWHVIAFGRFAQYQLFIYKREKIKDSETMAAITEVGAKNAFLDRETERRRDRETAKNELANVSPSLPLSVFPSQGEDIWQAGLIGSNTWAASAKKSASGHPLLFINPHQPFFGPGQWIEGHINSATGWHMSGASFPGSPFPTVGHNDTLGWSHTVNAPDVIDLWTEKFDDAKNPMNYKYGTGYLTAKQWVSKVAIKTDAGVVNKTFEFRKTHHGPIVAIRDGKPLTVKMAMFEEGGGLEQRFMMGRAKNLAEFKAAMARTAVPMFNTMYADQAGNIWYCYYGAVPRRDTRFDWTKPLDGSDPTAEWKGYHKLDELPQVLNPATGWAQNCNATPFLATAEGSADNPAEAKFPKYMVTEPDNSRSRMSRVVLSEKEKFSFEDWATAAFDNRCIEAQTLVPLLSAEWDKLNAANPTQAAKTAEAIQIIKAWNQRADLDAVGMSLFTMWAYARMQPQAKQMTKALPFPETAILSYVLDEFTKKVGTWKVAWGEISRLQRIHTSGALERFDDDKPSLPVPGGPGEYVGIIFNFYTPFDTPIAKGLKRHYGQVGHSFVSVVEFGPKLQARSLIQFGQRHDPASKHWFDQGELYAKRQFKPAWYRLEEIKANLEAAYHPGEATAMKMVVGK